MRERERRGERNHNYVTIRSSLFIIHPIAIVLYNITDLLLLMYHRL